MKVLVIENEKAIKDALTLAFMKEWPGTELLFTCESVKIIEILKHDPPDIILLDTDIPDIDDIAFLRDTRRLSDVPVIALSGVVDEKAVSGCIEHGADDFIVKPLHKAELLTRVKTILKKRNLPEERGQLGCGSLRCRCSERRFYYNKTEISLTVTEADILYHLLQNAGGVVRHDNLIKAVWGDNNGTTVNTLKVHIFKLRKKLRDATKKHSIIETWPGVGYSLVVAETQKQS